MILTDHSGTILKALANRVSAVSSASFRGGVALLDFVVAMTWHGHPSDRPEWAKPSDTTVVVLVFRCSSGFSANVSVRILPNGEQGNGGNQSKLERTPL